MPYDWQGCTKSEECYRKPGHTGRCGQYRGGRPSQADKIEMALDRERRRPITERGAIAGRTPFKVTRSFALHCREMMPDMMRPGGNRRVGGPAIVTRTDYNDGGFDVDVQRDNLSPDLYCGAADCPVCQRKAGEAHDVPRR